MFNLNSTSLRKSVKILAIGNYSVVFIDIIQGLIFIPLYLTFIGERMYGLWLGSGGILAILAFLDLGIASLIIQRVSREFGLKNYVGIAKYFFGGLLVNIFLMFILFVTGFLISYWAEILFKNAEINDVVILKEAFLIALVALVLSLLNNVIEGTLNALQKPMFSKVIQIISVFSSTIFVYILLLGGISLLAIPFGMLMRALISFLPNFIYLVILFLKNKIPLFLFDKLIIIDYLKYTPSLILSKLGTSILSNIEPLLINIFLSPEIAVYYSVTQKIGLVLRTLLDRIGNILFPAMSFLYSDKGKVFFKNVLIKIFNYLLPVSFGLFLFYFLLNEFIVNMWVGKTKYLGNTMTLFISISLFINYISNLLSYLLITTGDVKYPNNIIFLESIAKIIFIYFSLSIFGIIGMPIAFGLIGLLFSFVYLKRWDKLLSFSKSEVQSIFKQHFKYALSLFLFTTLAFSFFKLINEEINFIMLMVIALGIFISMCFIIFISSETYKSFILSKLKNF